MKNPYTEKVKLVAESLESKGWKAYYRDSSEEKIGLGDCFSCKKSLTKTGIFGIGLQYCETCKIAIDVSPRDAAIKNRVVLKYWDGNLYSSGLYELVEMHFSQFEKIHEQGGGKSRI